MFLHLADIRSCFIFILICFLLLEMIKVGLELDTQTVKEVLNATVIEIERNQKKIANPGE